MKITREEVIAKATEQLIKDAEQAVARYDRRVAQVKEQVDKFCLDIFNGPIIENCDEFKLIKWWGDYVWECSFMYDGFKFEMFSDDHAFMITEKLYIKKKHWGWKRIQSAAQFLNLVEKGKV